MTVQRTPGSVNPPSRRSHTGRLHATCAKGAAVGLLLISVDCSVAVGGAGGVRVGRFLRMKQIVLERQANADAFRAPKIDLFYSTADDDEEAVGRLTADAGAAGVR